MIKKFLFVGLIFLTSSNITAQQLSLPNLTIRSIGTRVIVSWKQDYKKPISNLNIQRSYDSLKNYKTIGEVLSPQSIENGYIDANPPYNKMYYRVFVAFEGGSYAYSNIYRAKKDTSKIQGVDMPNTNLFPITKAADNFPWLSIKPNENIVLLDEKPKNSLAWVSYFRLFI